MAGWPHALIDEAITCAISPLVSCAAQRAVQKRPPHAAQAEALLIRFAAYTTPKASIASATFLKPAMFAPFT